MSLVPIKVTGKFPCPGGGGVPVGTVTFQLTAAMRDSTDGEIVAPQTLVATLDAHGRLVDSAGHLWQTLDANDSPGVEPAGTRYWTTVSLVGGPAFSGYITVPAAAPGGTIDLSALLPA